MQYFEELARELLDPLRDFISMDSLYAHKYQYPALLARAQEALEGLPRVLDCDPDCPDCQYYPQDMRDPLTSDQEERHQMSVLWEENDQDLMFYCSCGASWPRGEKSYKDHVCEEDW